MHIAAIKYPVGLQQQDGICNLCTGKGRKKQYYSYQIYTHTLKLTQNPGPGKKICL
jgi:hypothetical protein